jgi:hypothetical protein
MSTSSEAIFVDFRYHELFVSDVPPTMFGANEQVVLAIQVTGTKAVKTPGGEVTLPSGKYVGAYKCRQDGCADFFS